MGDNCSVYMQIKAAISQMAALLYLPMSSAILRLLASLWSVILGKRGLVFNSLTFSCYLASILCKNAEMPHFRAAFLLCIFFINTFWCQWWDSNPHGVATNGF